MLLFYKPTILLGARQQIENKEVVYIFVKIIVKLVTFFIYAAIYIRYAMRPIYFLLHKIRLKLNRRKFKNYVRQELEKCPDDTSRSRRFAEIQRAYDERSTQVAWHSNMMARLYTSFLELGEAFRVNNDYLKDKTITEIQRRNAPSQFQRAKEQILVNARWALNSASNKDNLEELVSIVEPICIDDFDAKEWNAFLKSTQRIMKKESKTFLDQYSDPSV